MKTHEEMEVWSYHSWPWHKMDVSDQLHVPAALTPPKSPQYPLDGRLCGPQSRSERYGEEEI
jgi:hypothetical protein